MWEGGELCRTLYTNIWNKCTHSYVYMYMRACVLFWGGELQLTSYVQRDVLLKKKWLGTTFRWLVYSGVGTLPLTQMGVITGATKKSWMCIKCGCLGPGTQLGRWRAPSTQSCQGLLARADETLDCTGFWKPQSNPVLPGTGTAAQQLAELTYPSALPVPLSDTTLAGAALLLVPAYVFFIPRYNQFD